MINGEQVRRRTKAVMACLSMVLWKDCGTLYFVCGDDEISNIIRRSHQWC
jgi:hypothetical protein